MTMAQLGMQQAQMQPGVASPGMVMIVQKDSSMCHYDGCYNTSAFVCNAVICCKQYGCGKLICADHRSRKCILKKGKRGPPQYTCIDHEKDAHQASCRLFGIFFGIWLLFIILIVTLSRLS